MILDLILLLRTNSSWLFAFVLVILTVFYRRSRPKAEENGKRRGVDRSLTYARQYPCGWYRICNSDDVKQRGRLKHVAALGREMIVFRSDDENAEICVMDAFCSHMGANLGFGGKVIPGTNCVQCPFHLWEFEGKTGRCTKVPYLDGKIPDKSSMLTYSAVERYGMILIWFHPLNEEPHYEPIEVEDLTEEMFENRGVYNYPNIQMHLQEFAENAADFQHFQPLHGQMLIPWTEIRVPHVFVQHKASLVFNEEKGHIAYFYDTAMLKIFDKLYPKTKVDASITFFGPGGITLFRFDGEFGRLYLFHTHTPTDFTQLDVQFRAFVQRKIPRILSWYIIGNWIAQWRRDIIVWENKIFKRAPFLVKNDGPILKMRRWYNQFYLSKEAQESLCDPTDW